jgi:uncharacterized protein involved in exopolysaccharide biosynthesis
MNLEKQSESQIEKETISLLGKKSIKGTNSLISDTVRSEMVNDFVKNSVELNSLIAQRETLRSNYNNLKTNQKMIPEIQKTLTMLQEKEKNLKKNLTSFLRYKPCINKLKKNLTSFLRSS